MSEVKEFMHVDDWIDNPSCVNEQEKVAKAWMDNFRLDLAHRNEALIKEEIVFCEYGGTTYRCIGCSRLGDVWLTTNYVSGKGSRHRVNVAECSNWSVHSKAELSTLVDMGGGYMQIVMERGMHVKAFVSDKISIGSKITDMHGAAGVVCKTFPLHDTRKRRPNGKYKPRKQLRKSL